MKEKDLYDHKMPPYRPYERPKNGGMRVIDPKQKPIKLKHKRD